MTSLMSIFDPSTSLEFINISCWISIPMSLILMFKNNFWKSFNSLSLMNSYAINYLLSNFNLGKVVFIMLFVFILNMNFMGLLPLVFSPTSHLSLNLSTSLLLWTGMMIFYMSKNLFKLTYHLTPLGCPMVLVPFMVLIELVSNIIRPLTLSMRLMANVMAGHMILTLISKGVFMLNILVGLPMMIVLIMFLLFELGVAFIQSYVFSNLMYLYWEESKP